MTRRGALIICQRYQSSFVDILDIRRVRAHFLRFWLLNAPFLT